MDNTNYFKRFSIMTCIIILIIIVFEIVMMKLQLDEGESYRQQAIQRTATTVTMTAARGEIVDRYGRAIAQNRMGYNIVFSRADMPKGTENEVIWQLTKILTAAGETWVDNCPIIISSSGVASFVEGEDAAISKMKSTLTLQPYATAQNCLDAMNEMYDVGQLSPDIARTIMGVRLNMEQMEFSSANPYTFAEDVSLETMQKVLENRQILRGVDVTVMPIREYTDGTIAPHLIGNTGPIYAEEYQELKKKGYKIVDIIGKFGIEKAYEDNLRGTDGKKKILRDENGTIIYEETTQNAVPGNTIVLTIDSDLQRLAQKSLGTTIRSVAASGGKLTGGDCDSGAIVVMNCRTFEVLAAVTYPSFDLNTYNAQYDELTKQAASPLFNRAFNGLYAPGSTFKPVVALAGLQEGVITTSTTTFCNRTYVLEEYKFRLGCIHAHGSCNVVRAISVSCNIFFYETGYRLGITRMNDYCRQFGFGMRTGVGLGESQGTLAGREDRESREENWYAADTLTASIGQNDNKFTMLQMAVYTSTMANGGSRYEARIIKTIKSYDMTDTIVADTSENPVLLNKVNVENWIINTVKEGMRKVTSEGTASASFNNYPIEVGGKTGSIETIKNVVSSTGLFIAFAPFDDPEIVVAIVGEKCQYGSNMAQVARDIFDEYFFSTKTNGYDVLADGQLVS